MHKVIVFTHNATPEDNETVHKVLQTLGHETRLLNIPNHRPEDHLKSCTVALCFGKLAHLAVTQHIQEAGLTNVKRVEALPPPKYLSQKQDNIPTRQATWEQIQELREYLALDLFQPTDIHITELDLPDLSARHLLLLQKLTEEEERKVCFQTTKNGKLISIGEEDPNSKADIHLSFEELYTLRLIMDVLDVTEVSIADSEADPSRPGRTSPK